MRISDWSSDVCPSDLLAGVHPDLIVAHADQRGELRLPLRLPFGKGAKPVALRAVHIDIGVGPHHHVARDRRPVIIEPLVVEFAPETQRVAIGQHNVALERIAGAMNLGVHGHAAGRGSEEHTSELQSLMRHSYAVFCLKKKKTSY